MYFLNWKGFGMLRRKALENLKPDVIIVVNGTKVKITSVTSVKSAIEEYELDEPATYDPGSGTAETFINSVEVKWQKKDLSEFVEQVLHLEMKNFKNILQK